MPALNCLIVEDEPLAADVIRDYVMQVPGLAIKGICENAFEAMEKLRDEKIDLIFLDINLPKLSGIDLIKAIKSRHHIILTTAYHHYALEGYDLNVTDYLLKPVEFSRFLQAVNKVFERVNGPAPALAEKKHFFFNVDKEHIKVMADEIVYVEGLKDYVRIHTATKKLVTKFQVSDMEQLLKGNNFLRVHKSFIVNVAMISSFTATQLNVNGTLLKIGRTYRKAVEDVLKKPAAVSKKHENPG